MTCEQVLARIQEEKLVAILRGVPMDRIDGVVGALVRGGVKGIWNFTNLELKLEGAQDVVVENVHFADSLLTLSYMISGRDHNGEEE